MQEIFAAEDGVASDGAEGLYRRLLVSEQWRASIKGIDAPSRPSAPR